MSVVADGPVLAHAVSLRSDLPVSTALVAVAAGVVLVATFAGLAALWRRPLLRGDEAGRPLPAALQAVLDHPLLRWSARLVVLLAAAGVVFVALFGSNESAFNLSSYAFYITFWVGLVPASLLLGPVWRAVNPLRTIYRLLAPLAGPPPAEGQDVRLGVYPAAAVLAAYTWLELVYPERALPQTVGTVILLYTIVQVVGALWYGEEWFARADAFEVWSTLLGRYAVLGRGASGRLVLRNPLDGGAGTPAVPGLASFLVVMIGSTAFDGVSRTVWWSEWFPDAGASTITPTLGLAVTIVLVGALYAVTTLLAGRIGRAPGAPGAFAHTLVPIAAGYAIAHYFSLLLLEGQLTWILISNPLYQDGVDLFGTFRNEVDLTVVTPEQIAAVQVSAIVLGHVLAVVLAHERALRVTPGPRTARASQYPLLAAMVGLTVGGLALLLG